MREQRKRVTLLLPFINIFASHCLLMQILKGCVYTRMEMKIIEID